jgi:hypothetical protein
MNNDNIVINKFFNDFKEYLKKYLHSEDIDNLYFIYTSNNIDEYDIYFQHLDKYFYSCIGSLPYKLEHHVYAKLDKKKLIEHALIQIKFNKD